MAQPKRHFIIPDTQVREGVPLDHFDWIGRAIKDYAPDVVVHLGDHWDFPSLSRWSADGSLDKEGQRLAADIRAGNDALDRLHKAMGGFKPKRQVLLRGNHEHRLTRYVQDRPVLDGVLGFGALNDKAHGWEVIEYDGASPGQVVIDGVTYAHYFPNPNTGKPTGGTITNRLAKIGTTFVQGHVQGLLQGNVQYATGKTMHGIVAGSAYLHDEEYRGPANRHFRGVLVLNEVAGGTFYEMALTLDYLCRKYTGTSLPRYLQRKYRNAKERFTLARAA